MSADPYVYPDTDVLRNQLGIRDPEELRRAEAELTDARAARLAEETLPGRYDLGHLQGFHRALFHGLYEWAGQLRSVAIAKSELFCLPQHLETYGADVFGHLASERQLTGLARKPFTERLASYLGDVNALHPFREGNGRAQRAFFGQLAATRGYHIHWERIDPEQNIAASIAAMRGQEAPLRELLEHAVESIALERTQESGVSESPRRQAARELDQQDHGLEL